jgi:alginate O-acetyltransferase complex protein AlgI
MIFTEGGFAIFLPIVFAGWLVLRRRDGFALAWLLLSSLIFYGYHRWWTVTILLGYALVDWSIGLWLPRTKRPGIVLATGLGFNLLVLSCWKYTPLLLDSAAALFGRPWLRLDPLSSGNWFVPIGISFYSFSGISYMVDVHRGSSAPEPSFIRYALFTSFFPHLVAGPILRANEFLAHLRPGWMPDRPLAFGEAAFLLRAAFSRNLFSPTASV